jgi:hypothetical protein
MVYVAADEDDLLQVACRVDGAGQLVATADERRCLILNAVTQSNTIAVHIAVAY